MVHCYLLIGAAVVLMIISCLCVFILKILKGTILHKNLTITTRKNSTFARNRQHLFDYSVVWTDKT